MHAIFSDIADLDITIRAEIYLNLLHESQHEQLIGSIASNENALNESIAKFNDYGGKMR